MLYLYCPQWIDTIPFQCVCLCWVGSKSTLPRPFKPLVDGAVLLPYSCLAVGSGTEEVRHQLRQFSKGMEWKMIVI